MPTAPSSYTQPDLYRFAEALLTYATTLAFYLHLRASPKYAQRPDLLRTHPILSRLLTLKQSLHTLEELDFAASDDESGLSSSEFDNSNEDDEEEFDWMADAQDLWAGNNTLKRKGAGLEQDELEELLREAGLDEHADAADGIVGAEQPGQLALDPLRAHDRERAALPQLHLGLLTFQLWLG